MVIKVLVLEVVAAVVVEEKIVIVVLEKGKNNSRRSCSRISRKKIDISIIEVEKELVVY